MKFLDVTIEDWCKLLGIVREEMPTSCEHIIHEKEFRYRPFSEKERDMVLLSYLKKMDQNLSISGENEISRWERGWSENLEDYRERFDKKSLIPRYVKNGLPVRMFGNFVKSLDSNFENNLIDLLRTFLFEKYFCDKDCIYEFGCGTGCNLVAFAELDNEKQYFGLDWVPQSAQIISLIRRNMKINIQGGTFDMFAPDNNLKILSNSAAFTFGSLEQLGTNYEKFLQFLLTKPFDIYVHVGSILEHYDIENNLIDYLTYRYEKHRHYCDGFFTELLDLHRSGFVNILKIHRVRCGGLLGEGYSMTVWEKEH